MQRFLFFGPLLLFWQEETALKWTIKTTRQDFIRLSKAGVTHTTILNQHTNGNYSISGFTK